MSGTRVVLMVEVYLTCNQKVGTDRPMVTVTGIVVVARQHWVPYIEGTGFSPASPTHAGPEQGPNFLRGPCGIGARHSISHVITELVCMGWMVSVVAAVVVVRQRSAAYTQELSFCPCIPPRRSWRTGRPRCARAAMLDRMGQSSRAARHGLAGVADGVDMVLGELD